MVNNSKILTVSYGTFSCTLEGFDDSFGTMKAIAEYFRDLAADDRYFGAEPPAPDAEMLARIAEREIARRVEAHREDNTFVLRADTQGSAATPAAPSPEVKEEPEAPAAQEQAEPSVPEAVADSATQTQEEQASSEPESTDAGVEAPTSEPAPEEAGDAPETAEADAPEALSEEADSEIEGLSTLVAESQASAEAEDVLETQESQAEASEDADSEEAPSDSSAQLPEEDPTGGDTDDDQAEDQADIAPATVAAPEPDSVAAKLQRIRDVVSRNETASTSGDYSEDEHANDVLSDEEAATEEFLTGAQDDIAAALAADDEEEAAEIHADEAVTKRAAEDEDEAEAEAEASSAPEDAFEIEEDAEDEDDIGALLDKLSASDAAGETDPANDALSAETFVDETEDEAEDVSEDLAEVDAPAPVRARVIKMKREDFEAAVAEGSLEEDDGNEDGDKESSLSADEEDELMRELAAVEAELAQGGAQETATEEFDEDGDDTANLFSDDLGEDEDDEDYEDEDRTDDADAMIASTLRSERGVQLSESGADEEMGRILEETNTKLEEDEGRGRRSAIAHLRAAVKATKAERDLGGDLGATGRDTEAYRDDLETVVRPRRPMTTTHTARPSRAAPLKLVAEQRVDTPKPEGPVQPRRVRVSQAQMTAEDADESFADYVESVGAHNLSEVLEAAASYMAFVEGQDAFSRPQLMQKLGETEHADTSREDRLRSFGQLLRAGKIRKLGSGRFEAAEDIAYRPAS